MPDNKQLASFEDCIGENPETICNLILNNTPDVKKLLAKKEKNKQELICKSIEANRYLELCIKDQ